MGDRQTDARRHVPTRTGEELLFNRQVGSRLRERRLEVDLTQDQLAVQAGMTRGSIANIERGEQMPGLYRLHLICTALGWSVGDVLPRDAFTPESVADTLSVSFSTALKSVRREAQKQRESAQGIA